MYLMDEGSEIMHEAIQNVLLFQEQQATSALPEIVRSADSFDKLPPEYAVIAASALCNIFMPGALPIELKDPKDVRFLTSAYNYGIDYGVEYKNARTDSLTGLMNRLGLMEWGNQQYDPTKLSYAILAIDLVKFKAINDKFGHGVGDTALQQASNFIQSHIRVSSKSEKEYSVERKNKEDKDVVARTGGDEYYVVMDLDGVGRDKAIEIMERVTRELEATIFTVNGKDNESVSYGFRVGGVTSIPDEPLDFKSAVKMADDLMIAKKKSPHSNARKTTLTRERFNDLVLRYSQEH